MATIKDTHKKADEWITGSAYDFLGLTPEESAYVDLKLRLSSALKTWRRRETLSQGALAKKLRSSQSRIAKMERGDPSVTIDLLLRGLIQLGVTRSEIARVLVFEEPKSLVLSEPVRVEATGERKNVYWYQFPVKESRHYGSIKTEASSGNLEVNYSKDKREVAYG